MCNVESCWASRRAGNFVERRHISSCLCDQSLSPVQWGLLSPVSLLIIFVTFIPDTKDRTPHPDISHHHIVQVPSLTLSRHWIDQFQVTVSCKKGLYCFLIDLCTSAKTCLHFEIYPFKWRKHGLVKRFRHHCCLLYQLTEVMWKDWAIETWELKDLPVVYLMTFVSVTRLKECSQNSNSLYQYQEENGKYVFI